MRADGISGQRCATTWKQLESRSVTERSLHRWPVPALNSRVERGLEAAKTILHNRRSAPVISALNVDREWNERHEAFSYRTTIFHRLTISTDCDMEQRKFISLPKIRLRERSKARTEADSDEDAMDVDPTTGIRAAQSASDLPIGPSAPGLSTPDDQESSGMRIYYSSITYPLTPRRITQPTMRLPACSAPFSEEGKGTARTPLMTPLTRGQHLRVDGMPGSSRLPWRNLRSAVSKKLQTLSLRSNRLPRLSASSLTTARFCLPLIYCPFHDTYVCPRKRWRVVKRWRH